MNLRTRLHYLTSGLVFILTSFSNPVSAHTTEEESKISVVTLSGSADSDDGYEYFLDSNVALADGQRLGFSIGRMVVKSPESDLQIEPVETTVSLASSSSVIFPLLLELGYWDEEHTEVKTLRGGVGYQSDPIGIWFKPQFREFNFNAARQAIEEFSSEGYSVNIDVELMENVSAFMGYSKNYYSEFFLNVTQVILLSNLGRLKLMNSVGFADHIYRVGGSAYYSRGSFSAYWLRSRSAIDSSISYGYGGTLEIELIDEFSLGVAVDAQTAEQSDSDFYSGTLFLSYYW